LGAKVTHFERRAEVGYAIDVDAIRAAMTPKTRLIVVSNLYNPVGIRTDDDTLRALATLAESYNAYVLVDEVYLEWLRDVPESDRVNPDPVRSAAALSPQLITTSSLTKAFGLGALHLGWSVAAPPVAARIRKTALLAGATPSHPSEQLALRALASADAIVSPWRTRTMHHRALVASWVAATAGASWCAPDAGATAFINLGRGDTRALIDRLIREYDTAVVPGHFFGASEYVRIGLGIETTRLSEGLRRLNDALAPKGVGAT